MDLADLLSRGGIDTKRVLVLRHRPSEPEFNRVLPWLAAERPNMYNAYQQTQGVRLERTMSAMVGSGFVASFIGHEPGKALYVGLYAIAGAKPLTFEDFWNVPVNRELKAYGMRGWTEEEKRHSLLWFNLELMDFYADWKGKLSVVWPPPERSWWRWASRNTFPISAILEESMLEAAMPEWDQLYTAS